VHLLAYWPDPDHPGLAAELQHVLAGRQGRVPTMVARLRALGIEITEDDVRRAADGAVASGRPHVADALVTLGVVPDRTAAFDRYLGWGKPAHVDRYAVPLDRALTLVREAGGVTVVAHPWGRGGLGHPDEETFAELQGLGLTGIEVDHQDHDPVARDRLRAIARNLDLVVTGSSDYHGDGKADHELGCNTTAPDEFDRLTSARATGTSGAPHRG
jgi:predicted metal-dependent phosphoesterase TrpH